MLGLPCVGAAMTRANEVIRRARERLELTAQEAASRAGLSVHDCGDLERQLNLENAGEIEIEIAIARSSTKDYIGEIRVDQTGIGRGELRL